VQRKVQMVSRKDLGSRSEADGQNSQDGHYNDGFSTQIACVHSARQQFVRMARSFERLFCRNRKLRKRGTVLKPLRLVAKDFHLFSEPIARESRLQL
jgi:hypothetical protein